MNQHHACLFLFERISHGDSKYGHEIQKLYNFWTFCEIFDLSSALAYRVKSIKFVYTSFRNLHFIHVIDVLLFYIFQIML